VSAVGVQQRQLIVGKVAVPTLEPLPATTRTWRCRGASNFVNAPCKQAAPALPVRDRVVPSPIAESDRSERAEDIDPLYLFACHMEWEKDQEPSAAWELIAAAQSSNSDTRSHARALLASSHHVAGMGWGTNAEFISTRRRAPAAEVDMKAPYGLDIVDNCTECTNTNSAFFCAFSDPVLQSLNAVSHKTVLPPGALLFVEGQEPRGLFIICSGKVNLSTTSREGKILILKTAIPGEVLGLSASVSGMPYEITAETATPCQLSFIARKHFLELMELHSETGMRTAQCLSREFRSAYRDIHDLVLTRSSIGKLARLLLAQSSDMEEEDGGRITQMTHEEMGQRIGASRETVTRLLTRLRRKRLIRLDGDNLVIRDRPALEAISI
jgi:CRP/FNR family cyclic AMP-dependent transcriptional regulator